MARERDDDVQWDGDEHDGPAQRDFAAQRDARAALELDDAPANDGAGAHQSDHDAHQDTDAQARRKDADIMMWLWLADRSTGLVAFATLWFAALTGIAYNARSWGFLHKLARAAHVPASTLASVTLLMHVALGSFDAWLVLSRQVPHPKFSDAWLVIGVLIGLSAFLLIVTAVVGFLDAKRFKRPWDPRTVHLFAYGGFAFAMVHAFAVGTDMKLFVASGVVASVIFVVIALALRAKSAPPAPA